MCMRYVQKIMWLRSKGCKLLSWLPFLHRCSSCILFMGLSARVWSCTHQRPACGCAHSSSVSNCMPCAAEFTGSLAQIQEGLQKLNINEEVSQPPGLPATDSLLQQSVLALR